MKDCNKCGYLKARINPYKGVKIPGGFGKCIRPGGHCDPDIVRGGIGEGPRVRMKEESHENEI